MREYHIMEATTRRHEELVKHITQNVAPGREVTATEQMVLEHSARDVAEAKHAYYEACKRLIEWGRHPNRVPADRECRWCDRCDTETPPRQAESS
jgi:hypothetical protein